MTIYLEASKERSLTLSHFYQRQWIHLSASKVNVKGTVQVNRETATITKKILWNIMLDMFSRCMNLFNN